MDDNIAILRVRDFWGSLMLMGLSFFFLWRTFDIPLWGGNRAGVTSADWYNSAAIVPLGIFAALFVLSIVLLIISVRAGGANRALTAVGIGWHRDEAIRFTTIGIILFFYIAGLVPRVDLIITSGLLITALTFGYYQGQLFRMVLAAACVALCGVYALVVHMPQAEWRAHDDDILTLIVWIALTGYVLWIARGDWVLKSCPVIAVIVPVLLVTAMAFGFRQNVPNRGGLFFKHIEYHYYVSLRPLWSS